MNKTTRTDWNNNTRSVNFTAVPLRGCFRVGLGDRSGSRGEVVISKVSSILLSNSQISYDVLNNDSRQWMVCMAMVASPQGYIRPLITLRQFAWMDFEKCTQILPEKFRKFNSMVHRKKQRAKVARERSKTSKWSSRFGTNELNRSTVNLQIRLKQNTSVKNRIKIYATPFGGTSFGGGTGEVVQKEDLYLLRLLNLLQKALPKPIQISFKLDVRSSTHFRGYDFLIKHHKLRPILKHRLLLLKAA